MAEVKNTFIQSKMNQDLDGRIIPNGQYRKGVNIQISRSEGDDVGALENVLGTKILTDFGLTDPSYEIIGHVVDLANDIVYVFITDYSDSSTNQSNNNITGQNSAFGLTNKNCFIAFYNNFNQTGGLLVGGDFLNFSKTHPITGVNLVEDLLFWTDNRNQPRKININTALGQPFVLGGAPGYYTNEDHISVAKYYPFECISLLDFVPGQQQWESSMTNKTEQWLPPFCAAKVSSASWGPNTIKLSGEYTNIPFPPSGPQVLISGRSFQNHPTTGQAAKVHWVFPPVGGETQITLDSSLSDVAPDIANNDIVYFQFPNPDYDSIWPGDETFLSDKFVRFSYRFEFDDGEYSLMAPFTQACFIPKQDGYFIGKDVDSTEPADYDTAVEVSKTLIGDEGNAYASSIVEFFENKVQDIGLYIPAPYQNNTQIKFDNLQSEFKVKNIEIIYKESDSTVAYVLDTIKASSGTNPFNLETSSYYKYDYQSRKPWKTLPNSDITRVSDKVPIKALAQESAGNRIIYGNYLDKHTSPDSLTYVVGIDPKGTIPAPHATGFGDKDYYVRKEYQNHTVKQNRTYQVGVVLSDRYGRQSDVILSDVFNEAVNGYGSTIFHPYRSTQDPTITTLPTPDTWPGDIINMIWHQGIPEAPNDNGYPGIYKNNDGTLVDLVFELGDWYGLANNGTTPCGYSFDVYQPTPSGTATASISIQIDTSGQAIPGTVVINSSSGDWLEGGDVFIDTSSTLWPLCAIPAVVPPEGTYSLRAKTLVNQNTLGWYSWKVVVKQQEQDYYNCYLPGILAGYPKDLLANTDGFAAVSFPKGNQYNTSHIVLLNDNINKVPRDLREVGPTQQMFGSSVKLYGRVENYKTAVDFETYNRQFDPETLPDTVVNIGTVSTMELGAKVQAGGSNQAAAPNSYPTATSILMPINFFNGKANPLVAQISTKKEFGYRNSDGFPVSEDDSLGMIPYLAVYETEPVTSNLDIYWETSTGGLISDLNYNILTVDNTVPCDIREPSITWSEADPPGSVISSIFQAVSCAGVDLDNPVDNCTVQLLSVKNLNNDLKTWHFKLEKDPFYNRYWIELSSDPYEGFFLAHNDNNARTWVFTFQVDRPAVTISPILSIPAFSAQYTRTVQVQNAKPNQVGMFAPVPGNNARAEIKNAVFNMTKQYMNYGTDGEETADNPNYVIVGEWQEDNPYNNDPDNAYYSTFGRNYIDPLDCEYVFYPDGNMGYGTGDVGQQDFFPTGRLDSAYHKRKRPSKGYKYPPSPSVSKNFGKYLNRKIKMIKKPGWADYTWDGTFKAYNGASGSVYGTPWSQVNTNRGQELVFEVVRAYQVSAFYPLQIDVAEEDCGAGVDKNQAYAKWSIAEVVFSNDGAGNPTPLVSALPNMGDGKIQTWKWPSGGAGANYPLKDGVRGFGYPPGPVYWNFKKYPSSGWNCINPWPTTGTAFTDPKDVATGGEAEVLQLYGSEVPGHHHYWKDLSDAISVDSAPIKRIWTVDEFRPLIKNGVILSQGVPCTHYGGDGSYLDDYASVPQRGFWYVNDIDLHSDGNSDVEHHIKTVVSLTQATYENNFGYANQGPNNKILEEPCFVIENDPPPALNSGAPQTAVLKTGGDAPIPPGRYVVTVRVTDRTIPNSQYDGWLARNQPIHPATDGLYFEWDIPVIINGPFSNRIVGGDFTWYNISSTGKPRNWSTYSWDTRWDGSGYSNEAPWYLTTGRPFE